MLFRSARAGTTSRSRDLVVAILANLASSCESLRKAGVSYQSSPMPPSAAQSAQCLLGLRTSSEDIVLPITHAADDELTLRITGMCGDAGGTSG